MEKHVETIRRELREMRLDLEQTFKDMAGADLEKILGSKAGAESCLCHPDRLRRLAALWALTYHWPCDAVTRRLIHQTATQDADVEVRAMAVSNFGVLYYQTKNKEVGKFLASAVLDKNHDLRIREAAYRALFSLMGIPTSQQPPLLGFELERDADWAFVNSSG